MTTSTLPSDWTTATLLGRAWIPGQYPGPSPITVRPDGTVVDLSGTVAQPTQQRGNGCHVPAVADVRLDHVAADPLLELGRGAGRDRATMVEITI